MTESNIDRTAEPTDTPELKEEARRFIVELIENPQQVGARPEDGTYVKTETENAIHETIAITATNSGTTLEAARHRTHEPEVDLPGKFRESMSLLVTIPGIASAHMTTMGDKIAHVDYADPVGKKNEEGLADALEAFRLAIDELKPSDS